jgi:hypothetical protein
MSAIALHPAPAMPRAPYRAQGITELTLGAALGLQAYAANKAAEATMRSREIVRNGAGPLVVVFIIAIVVLLVLAAAMSIAVVIFCAQKGMNFEWFVKTSWFEVKIACSR